MNKKRNLCAFKPSLMKVLKSFFPAAVFIVCLAAFFTPVNAQDTIVKKNGDVLKAKITEIGTDEIKFRTFGDADGPIITLKKSEIKTVKVGGQTIIDVKEDTENIAQDVIIKKNGDLLKVKVIEIGTEEVKFKLHNDPYGPSISIPKSEIKTMTVAGQTVIDVKTGLKEDVVVKKDGSSLKVKIIEVGADVVSFKLYNNPEGPTMSLKKSEIKTVTVDGQVVYEYKIDPYSVSNQAILDKNSSLKFHFFSPLNRHIAFSYEWMVKPGFNWEGGLGIIGPGVSPIDNATERVPKGTFLRFGPKFLLGNSSDIEIEGAKYAHPLKGRYFKIELTLNSMNASYSVDTGGYYNGGVYTPSGKLTYKKKFQGMAFNLIYGRQFIFGNTITVSWYGGIGYGFESESIVGTKPSGYWYDDFDPRRYSHWYYGKNFPLTTTFGFTVGYILRTPAMLAGKNYNPKPPTRNSMDK